MQLNDSSCATGHNRSDSIKNDRPASFKRMLGGILPRHQLNIPPRDFARELTIETVEPRGK